MPFSNAWFNCGRLDRGGRELPPGETGFCRDDKLGEKGDRSSGPEAAELRLGELRSALIDGKCSPLGSPLEPVDMTEASVYQISFARAQREEIEHNGCCTHACLEIASTNSRNPGWSYRW